MTARKIKRIEPIESEFDEVVARLLQTNPRELAASVAAEASRRQEEVRQRVVAARKEIEDGARPRKGRFRL